MTPPVSPFPAVVEIELTRCCNLACRMCQRQVVQAKDPAARLEDHVLDAVLEQCSGYAPQINLGGLGESLLHRRLPDLLARIKASNPAIRTGFNTNGLRLTTACFEWLLDGRVDYLSISVNAPNAAAYYWLTGSTAYDRIVAQARAFLVAKGKGNPPLTTVHMFALPRFAAAAPAFLAEWQPLADFVQIRELGNWAGLIDLCAFGVPLPELRRCDRPELSLAIDLHGGYHRCCASFALIQPAATVFDVPIEKYWNGEEMTLQRQEMQTLKFSADSPCRNCSGRAIPANTVIEHAALSSEPQHVAP
jgi:MoaA/NifB/PqqE/SkfB family radical SAM enzyme